MSRCALCRLKAIRCQHVPRISTTDGGSGVSRCGKAADYGLGRLADMQNQVIKSSENNEALQSRIGCTRRTLKSLQIGGLVSKQNGIDYGGGHMCGVLVVSKLGGKTSTLDLRSQTRPSN